MRRQDFKRLIFALFVGIGIFMIITNDRHKETPITVWTRFKPSSVDPMDYDLAVHHVAMRSVFASLVSLYRSGNIEPQIAKKWESNTDNKIWKLTIDTEWTFKNGQKVTPLIVLNNFKRVLLLKNKSDSKSGLLEYLENSKKI